MRVRCSTGLDVSSYNGHFYRMPANPTDVYLPAIDADKALQANIVHTEKLTVGSECYVQVRESVRVVGCRGTCLQSCFGVKQWLQWGVTFSQVVWLIGCCDIMADRPWYRPYQADRLL